MVASVSFAGACRGVVPFQDGLVAIVLVLFGGARADDAGIVPVISTPRIGLAYDTGRLKLR